MKRLKGNYANVVATLALVVAMAGGAYAAGLARDSVGAKQIKTGGVRSDEVKDEALVGADLDESTLGQVPAAANAQALQGNGPAAFLGATAKAADSEKLDNLDSTAFLGAGAQAADSDELDGLDSTDFAQGNAVVEPFAADVGAASVGQLISSAPIDLRYDCPTTPSAQTGSVFFNSLPASIETFTDDGSANPLHSSGVNPSPLTGPGAEAITFQLERPSRVDTLWVNVIHQGAVCHVQGLWIGGPY